MNTNSLVFVYIPIENFTKCKVVKLIFKVIKTVFIAIKLVDKSIKFHVLFFKI